MSRIRLFPTLISKMKWLGSKLPLKRPFITCNMLHMWKHQKSSYTSRIPLCPVWEHFSQIWKTWFVSNSTCCFPKIFQDGYNHVWNGRNKIRNQDNHALFICYGSASILPKLLSSKDQERNWFNFKYFYT